MYWGYSKPRGQIGHAIRALCAMLALTLSVLLTSPAQAQRATAQARAEAVVVTPLSFVKVDDLNFGSLVPSNTAGTVVLAPTGARTATGGVQLAAGAAPQPASFAGRGSRNQLVSIQVTSNTRTLTRVGGGDTMTMDTFIIGSTPTAQLTTTPLSFRITNTNGLFAFPIGATLRVKARQTPGTYTGTFSVTLNYQ